MKGLTLTQKEQARLQVLNGILEGQISVDEAAEVLGVSERHVWRILAEYRKEGAAALAHGNRGRRANNSIPEEARTQVVALARTRYARVMVQARFGVEGGRCLSSVAAGRLCDRLRMLVRAR